MKVNQIATLLGLTPTRVIDTLNYITKKDFVRYTEVLPEEIKLLKREITIQNKMSNEFCTTKDVIKKRKDLFITKYKESEVQPFTHYTLEKIISECSLPQIKTLIELKCHKYTDKLIELVAIIESYHDINNNYNQVIDIRSFSNNRLSQLNFQIEINNSNSNFEKSIQTMAVAAEESFERICKQLGLNLDSMNVSGDFTSPFDFILNGFKIDVKASCHHKNNTMKLTLNKNRIEKGEVIAFYKCTRNHYESYIINTELIGILNTESIDDRENYINTHSFYNPCHFTSLKSFLAKKNNRTENELDKNIIDSLIKNDSKHIAALMNYYKKDELVRYLNPLWGTVPLTKKIQSQNHSYSPIDLYNLIIESLKMKSSIDTDHIKNNIFHFFELNKHQTEYLNLLIDIHNVLPNFKCKFTNTPLLECEIKIINGIIYAIEPTQNRKNTLFAYSWVTGSPLSIASSSTEVCDDTNCGCLTHYTEDNIRVGKFTCPKYGQQNYYYQKEKNKKKHKAVA